MGSLSTKISNQNIIYSSQKPRKSLSLPHCHIFTVVFTRCVTNRCTGIYKFGNKYLPSACKTQFEFRSHFFGKKVRLIGREIRYIEIHYICCIVLFRQHVSTLWTGHHQATEVFTKSHMVYAYLLGSRSVSFTFKHILWWNVWNWVFGYVELRRHSPVQHNQIPSSIHSTLVYAWM
jgi:hypothetical protein